MVRSTPQETKEFAAYRNLLSDQEPIKWNMMELSLTSSLLLRAQLTRPDALCQCGQRGEEADVREIVFL